MSESANAGTTIEPPVLSVRIDYQRPIALESLVDAMGDLGRHYEGYIAREDHSDADPGDRRLYVRSVREGSAIFDLFSLVAASTSLITDGSAFSSYVSYVGSWMDFLGKRQGTPPVQPTSTELRQLRSMVGPIAGDPKGNMTISAQGDVNIGGDVYIDYSRANAVQNQSRLIEAELDTSEEHVHRNRVLQWHQAKFEPGATTGHRAIISAISPKPVKTVFADDTVFYVMTHPPSEFARPWQELLHVVDVEVQFVNGVPRLYNILRAHPESSIDPSED